jgi:hypothetical protein
MRVVEGGQRPWMHWKGVVDEVSFPRTLYLPLPAKCNLCTQETDINYGSFKSIIHNNLKQISSAFYAAGEIIPLGVLTFGLIIYGGTILVGKTNLTCRNALTDSLTPHQIFVPGARLAQCPTPGSASQIQGASQWNRQAQSQFQRISGHPVPE